MAFERPFTCWNEMDPDGGGSLTDLNIRTKAGSCALECQSIFILKPFLKVETGPGEDFFFFKMKLSPPGGTCGWWTRCGWFVGWNSRTTAQKEMNESDLQRADRQRTAGPFRSTRLHLPLFFANRLGRVLMAGIWFNSPPKLGHLSWRFRLERIFKIIYFKFDIKSVNGRIWLKFGSKVGQCVLIVITVKKVPWF